MTVQEMIDKLQTIENKSVDVLLHYQDEAFYKIFYGIIEDDIHLGKDGDLIIDIS